MKKISRWIKLPYRFWLQVNKNGPKYKNLGKCWVYTGCPGSKGHPTIVVKSKSVRAHRYSWEIHNGEIPYNMCVLHHCDNVRCVNPEHLFTGTQDDNMKDMAKKKRGRGKPPLGEGNGSAKLTVDKIKSIRKLWKTGKYTQRQLAKMFDVVQPTIHRVVTNYHWSHI